jgi:hypothetical protein
MKFKLIVLFISFNLFAQNNNYVNIKGTRLSIIPPKGFVDADNFVGLKKDETTGIHIMDLERGGFESNTTTYTRAKFEKRGITVLEFEELLIDGFKAKFSHLKDASSESVQIVFGDSTFSVMVIGYFPTSSREELFSEIKKAFLKIKYDKNLIIDPFASSAFKVEKNESKFKLIKASANFFMFSENGVENESKDHEPMVIITSCPFDETMTKEKLIEFSVNGLIQQGFVKKEIKNISEKSINGYNTMEVEYYFEFKSEPKLALITILVKDTKAIIFYGMAQTNFQENIIEFKKLSNKLTIK